MTQSQGTTVHGEQPLECLFIDDSCPNQEPVEELGSSGVLLSPSWLYVPPQEIQTPWLMSSDVTLDKHCIQSSTITSFPPVDFFSGDPQNLQVSCSLINILWIV